MHYVCGEVYFVKCISVGKNYLTQHFRIVISVVLHCYCKNTDILRHWICFRLLTVKNFPFCVSIPFSSLPDTQLLWRQPGPILLTVFPAELGLASNLTQWSLNHPDFWEQCTEEILKLKITRKIKTCLRNQRLGERSKLFLRGLQRTFSWHDNS